MQKIRYGMVGGGEGAFIGAIHRHAAQLDSQYELVCGAFSSTAERSLQTGLALGLDAQRSYSDYSEMLAREAELPSSQRMQCLVIVTPNHLHFPIALAAFSTGFHVLSDKPATLTLGECQQLAAVVDQSGLLYGLTHPYTAYPIIQEARQRVADGALGNIRKIIVEYTQGWLAADIETAGNAQAAWRVDPEKAGSSCCMGDIGVHGFNLCEYVSGLTVSSLSAELNTVVPGRVLDDDGTVLLKFDNGATGVLLASQICLGDENNLRLRIYDDKASLDWQQQEPNSLWLKYADKPAELLRTGGSYLGLTAVTNTRLPAGHPEGYIEAFANIYEGFAAQIRAYEQDHISPVSVPGMQAALRGMAFIETAVKSSATTNAWLKLSTDSAA